MDYYGNVMGPQYGYPQMGYGYGQPYPQFGSTPGAPLQMGNYTNYGPMQNQQQPQTNSDILSALLKSGAAAKYNFTGTNLAPQQSIASEMGNLANAQYDPNNATYQAIYGNENQTAKQDLASAISEAGRQNRKLTQLGRVPLFNPERGGEQAFRQTIQGYQTAQDTARQRARQILSGGQQALNTNFQNQNNLAQQTTQNNQKKAFGTGNIADFLPLLAKLF